MTSSTSPAGAQILTIVNQLRTLTQIDIQSSWQVYPQAINPGQGLTIPLNDRGHLAWPGGCQVLWLRQSLTTPEYLAGYALTGMTWRLVLTWWAELAEIFVNDQLVQTGDLFDCRTRILLSSQVQPGETITVTLRLVSPEHDPGALVRSLCLYEGKSGDPGMMADEIELLYHGLKYHPDAEEFFTKIQSLLQTIPWHDLPAHQSQFQSALAQVREQLIDWINQTRELREILAIKFSLVGHAHLDLAWLWPVPETWEVAQRTFQSVLQLQEDFPELIFCHSSPALYAWLAENRPDLFQQIQAKVAAGTWEVAAGLWVEPELNLISAESISRHLLYGQRFVREQFGQVSAIAWLPDTFGFCWQLPQLLKQGGVDYFVTQKLRWNDTSEFPAEVFHWQGLDGTSIFSVMLPPIGEGIEPVKMMEYAGEWVAKTGIKTVLWLPGVGDHGGGPTRDMLEVRQRWQISPICPRLSFSSALDYFRGLEEELSQQNRSVPVWRDELYLEFHRGCYTTHGDQKGWNRRCEGGLFVAELLASLATLTAGVDYPQGDLERAWKLVLFNQFHDILPGSAIAAVYEQANQDWCRVAKISSQITRRSLNTLAAHLSPPAPPHPHARAFLIFNPLNWWRSELVALDLPESEEDWRVYDPQGNQLTSQRQGHTLLFLSPEVPGLGCQVVWLCPQVAETLAVSSFASDKDFIGTQSTQFTEMVSQTINGCQANSWNQKNWVLESEMLWVKVDERTGNLTRIFDKVNQREVLTDLPANQLQLFTDQGQYWDAWNIDPNYQNYPLPAPTLTLLEWQEFGELRQRLRVIRTWEDSEFCQDYILVAGSPILTIENRVNWQTDHVIVKAAFPLNLTTEIATYEIPAGVIQRSTQPTTPEEQAKWEVPALNWADLSTPEYGVSLLNDSKYGYDATPSQLRLTLLRGSTWPDPEADRGIHQFKYGIYPHRGTWKEAETSRRGYELNQPLIVQEFIPSETLGENQRVPGKSYLNLQSDHLILMAFKRAEDSPHRWILRAYESEGKACDVQLENNLGLQMSGRVNLLEDPQKFSSELIHKIHPWQIATWLLDKSGET